MSKLWVASSVDASQTFVPDLGNCLSATSRHPNNRRCPLCDKIFPLKRDLERHMVKHTGLKPYPCPYCPFRTTRREHVSNHVKNKHISLYAEYMDFVRARKQRYLDINFNNVGGPGLSNYISCNGYDRFIHTDGEGNNLCLICQYSVKHRRNIYRHILTHTGDKPFRCTSCEFRSSRSDKLKHHIKTKHQNESIIIPDVSVITVNNENLPCRPNVTLHLLPIGDVENPAAPKRSDKKRTASEILQDMLMYGRIAQSSPLETSPPNSSLYKKFFSCHVCGYNTHIKRAHERHILTHTGEKPHKCDYCDFRSNRKDNLLTHVRKKHQNSAMALQLLLQAQENSNSSIINNNSALSLSGSGNINNNDSSTINLNNGNNNSSSSNSSGGGHKHSTRHRNFFDLENCNEFGKYKCPYDHCAYITNRRFPLSRHLLTHTGEKPFRCLHCHYSCSRKDALSSHMARRHPFTLDGSRDQEDFSRILS
ncbi:zinc finger protein 64 [Galendromus occidentalis]|uniref:Zinc finger protein 64 n=1 Tax=Galendromus occidentalis TaxID=34638 RepID=A0AAJ7SGA6_9ACAR|nr:zinc finger protein 64 [Galendromus occidentalis]